MRRGEIRWVDLDPTRGAESNKRRPADHQQRRANTTAHRLGRGVATVVPVTSNFERIYAFQTLLSAHRPQRRVADALDRSRPALDSGIRAVLSDVGGCGQDRRPDGRGVALGHGDLRARLGEEGVTPLPSRTSRRIWISPGRASVLAASTLRTRAMNVRQVRRSASASAG